MARRRADGVSGGRPTAAWPIVAPAAVGLALLAGCAGTPPAPVEYLPAEVRQPPSACLADPAGHLAVTAPYPTWEGMTAEDRVAALAQLRKGDAAAYHGLRARYLRCREWILEGLEENGPDTPGR